MNPSPIPMTPVSSSHIRSIGYDERTQTMAVQFKDGETYNYWGVPPLIHADLLTAPSKGKFFRQAVKGRFRTTKHHHGS